MIESNKSYKKNFENYHKIDYLNKLFYDKINNIFGTRIIDILLRNPKGYRRRPLIKGIIKSTHLNKFYSLDLKILSIKENFYGKGPVTINCINSHDQEINILFFNIKNNYLKKIYILNQVYRITGNIEYFKGKIQIIHPENSLNVKDLNSFEEIEPIYHFYRNRIDKKKFRELIKKNIKLFKSIIIPTEWINKNLIKKKLWKDYKTSLVNIHFPPQKSTNVDYNITRERLAYDEVLSNFLVTSILKKKENSFSEFLCKKNSISKKILNNLDFKLTNDQKKTYEEIFQDIRSNKKMYRLIQGDVGSGKTIVSLLLISNIVESNFQVAFMVPTEVLAIQHYEYFKKILKNNDISIEILTGKMKTSEKKRFIKE